MILIVVQLIVEVVVFALVLWGQFHMLRAIGAQSHRLALQHERQCRFDEELTQVWSSHAQMRVELAATTRLMQDLKRPE